MFIERKYDVQEVYEKIYNVANYQKCKSKPHSDISSYLSRMGVIKRTQITNASKDMGKREHFYTVLFSLIVAYITKMLHS